MPCRPDPIIKGLPEKNWALRFSLSSSVSMLFWSFKVKRRTRLAVVMTVTVMDMALPLDEMQY